MELSFTTVPMHEGYEPFRNPPSLTKVMLFGGARGSCCDEAVVVWSATGEALGLASIAPEGEEGSGVPTIVGVYVLPKARKGRLGVNVGTALLRQTVQRCVERGFTQIHMDVLSTGMLHTVQGLPPELQEKLVLNTESVGAMDASADLD